MVRKAFISYAKLLWAVVALTAVTLGLGSVAQAADYPAKPIKFVVPFGAGGGADTLARAFAEKLAAELKQAVIVENRPGASTVIGAEYVVRSPPDGYTLLFLGGGSLTPSLIKDLKINPLVDLKPVVALGRGGMSIMVNATLPVNDLQGLIAYSKKNPGRLNYGYSAASHLLAAELLKSAAGLDASGVPYRGGSQVMAALVANEIQLTVDVPLVYAGMLKDGRVRALTHGGQERSPSLPDVPILAESGVRDFFFPVSFGVWAPRNTPQSVIEQLNAAFNDALKSADIRQKLMQAGVVPTGGAPEAHARQVETEFDVWSSAARLTRFQPE